MIQTINIAWFLALRQVRRANKWTTILIIFVMTLTFLNLVVVSGILVGLIEGSVTAQKNYYSADFIISKKDKKEYIENTNQILEALKNMPDVEKYTARYIDSGTVEANYKQKTRDTDQEKTGASFVGIDPQIEDSITHVSKFIVEGSYLKDDDYDQILIGSIFVKKYTRIEAPGFTALTNIYPGAKVKISINGITREVTVKGILKSKVGEVAQRVYFPAKQFRSLIGRDDQNVGEIAVKLKPGSNPNNLKKALLKAGFDEYAKILTAEEAEPKFLKDIKATFALLGNAISSIGLVVASITIFIVIFINAITRRKFIGIMKGIGIDGSVIELSYVFQSVFYAIVGSVIGIVVVYGFLIPLIDAHPINFPFSDGILVATASGTAIRAGLLIVATVCAGYIPARMIVRRNTLDAILGRN